MNCTHAQERLTELLDPRNATDTTSDVRDHLSNCPECQREFSALHRTLSALDTMPAETPSPRLRSNFYAMLEEEKHSAASILPMVHRRKRLTLWGWILSPIAACGLLALGFIAGQRNAPATATSASDDSTKQQLAALQQKVDSMGQLVSYSILKQQPASERLKGVLATQELSSPTDDVLTQLISAVALDPSTNVRLTALESLYAHADKDVVRAGVLTSLSREQNPLVQIAMIDFLVAVQDQEAVSTFQHLAKQDNIDRSVRDAARRAIVQF